MPMLTGRDLLKATPAPRVTSWPGDYYPETDTHGESSTTATFLPCIQLYHFNIVNRPEGEAPQR